MRTVELFPTKIYTDMFPVITGDPDLWVDELRKTHIDWHRYKNVERGPTSPSRINLLYTKDTALDAFKEKYIKYFSDLHGVDLIPHTLWMNFASKNEHHGQHCHYRMKKLYSIVWYIKHDGKNGNLVIHNTNPQKLLPLGPEPLTVMSSFQHGVIAIPSWLEHETEANHTDNERISIVMDIGLPLDAPISDAEKLLNDAV